MLDENTAKIISITVSMCSVFLTLIVTFLLHKQKQNFDILLAKNFRENLIAVQKTSHEIVLLIFSRIIFSSYLNNDDDKIDQKSLIDIIQILIKSPILTFSADGATMFAVAKLLLTKNNISEEDIVISLLILDNLLEKSIKIQGKILNKQLKILQIEPIELDFKKIAQKLKNSAVLLAKYEKNYQSSH